MSQITQDIVTPIEPVFTFIDLFAGIGGFRIAFERAGGRCVFSSEWDKLAQKTYLANYGEMPAGDITTIPASDIPDHDILTAGFPCQPFSIAGVTKHNALGNAHGFAHATQGTLFFDVARIIAEKRPKAFVLENVKYLKNHDKGRTFAIIEETLVDELGYYVYHDIIDAQTVVPQHRERIYIVGFREPRRFSFPILPNLKPRLRDILEPHPDPKYTLTNHLWEYLQNYAEKHRAKGNGFGFGLTDPDGIARTLSARYYKDGSEILIPQEGKNPRRLTPRECARLMGFPETFQIVVSDTRAYKQFGNSVVVPVIEAVAREVARCLFDEPVRDTETLFPPRQLSLPLK
jgi:DNA (cytosine-5)-methyltransferase 1